MVTTSETEPWVSVSAPKPDSFVDVALSFDPADKLQTIDGFGTCFNELGWTSLSILSEEDRTAIFQELFQPNIGANFTICRMPIAANDFAIDWYSYNETADDLTMEHFSIENDHSTLIPFIKAAKEYNPNIKIWASPWSPPSWMKYNNFYTGQATSIVKMLHDAGVRPGMGSMRFLPREKRDLDAPKERGSEGTDMFLVEKPGYLEAYALYFAKFIEAYKAEGIDIFAVAPQNEYNSAQPYPACTWTAGSLARFIGDFLGPKMAELGVGVISGTNERANAAFVDSMLTYPGASQYIIAAAFQWAGKEALPIIHDKYPNLKLVQSEQECGNGKNDWRGALHAWELLKDNFNGGVSIYDYWNTSLVDGSRSTWGWAQNSLVIVNPDTKTYKLTPDYYILKHLSHYVLPGASFLENRNEFDDCLAFINPDKSKIAIVFNEADEPKIFSISFGNREVRVSLAPNSLSTIRIK